mgnify:CR=1 FL=1|tara:strand:+ start:1552 stop:1785 length:234 start_codon:yes stop_codon:yes gene_type:complete
MKISRKIQHNDEKRLFLIFGVVNFLITNLILQILLLLSPTFVATVFSQLVNVIIGFYLYGEKVFKFKKLNKSILKKN